MNEFDPADLIPRRFLSYAERHPKVILGAATALVAFSLYNLVESISILHKARRFVGELDRAASEALGG